jgi:hypothetical protein
MRTPEVLEQNVEWRSHDLSDPGGYTEVLDAVQLSELDGALRKAREHSSDLLEIDRDDFPLFSLREKLARIERELLHGRGFVVLRGLPRDRYDDDELCLLYWGIGLHLGRPWAQNQYGHVLGDVTDQGKTQNDPTSRGNEVGAIGLPYHSDGSDLVGLLCLRDAASGGESNVCNVVAIHNDMVRSEPALAAELYEPQPYDFRGEQRPGGKPYYMCPIFTECDARLFARYIRPYIRASQRHPETPRITEAAERAMQRLDEMTDDPQYAVVMELEPGDMQFINNYHVLHGRRPYQDDPATGRVRHLKRLWLETRSLPKRPPYFQLAPDASWEKKRTISRLHARP